MRDIDIPRPQDWGFNASERVHGLFLAFSQRQGADMINDNDDTVEAVARTFRNRLGSSICVIDLSQEGDYKAAIKATGITDKDGEFDMTEWESRRPYLVVRHLDSYVSSHKVSAKKRDGLDKLMSVLRRASESSRGVMVTYSQGELSLGEARKVDKQLGKERPNFLKFFLGFSPVFRIQ